MGWMLIVQLVCLGLVVVFLSATVVFLRSAGRYDKIAAKLRAGEELSAKERRMLDKVKS